METEKLKELIGKFDTEKKINQMLGTEIETEVLE